MKNNIKPITLTHEQLSKLQSIELGILKTTIGVIKKMGLRYMAIGGTALGAKKYKGFIPWDDDIDIAMPREDYEKFIKNAQQFFPSGFFVQSVYSDPNYCFGVSKVRKIDTIFEEMNTSKLNIVNGVFIDIFPIDGYIKGKTSDKFIYKLRQAKISSSLLQCKKKSFKNLVLNFIFFFMRKTNNYYCIKNEKLLSKIPFGNTERCFCRIEIFPYKYFESTILGSFSGVEIELPVRLHDYLKDAYGDYEKDIDDIKKVPHHYVSRIEL